MSGFQPVTNLRCTNPGHVILIVTDTATFPVHQPHVDRWLCFTVQDKPQRLIFFGGFHRTKGDLAEHKGVGHLAKQRIHTINHARRRAPVGVERVVRAHFAARLHIGKNIRAAKRVNRLFRVANQQQGRIRLMLPDTAENAILLRIGVLEFINHCHRKTATDGCRQCVAAFTAQRRIETTEHIVKTQLTASTFFCSHRFADLRQCPCDHQIANGQRLSEQFINGNKERMLWRDAARFGTFFQKTLGEFFQGIRQLITLRFFLRPGAYLLNPLALITPVKFTSVDPRGFQQSVQLINRIAPLLLDLVDACEDFFVSGCQRFIC